MSVLKIDPGREIQCRVPNWYHLLIPWFVVQFGDFFGWLSHLYEGCGVAATKRKSMPLY
ncbi:hypothetical protein HanIR_Chr14g0708261 [Helianthus annuus]|nr:hypothetical protein HanIR_Chr14g0708261 [Helianthus annuus]